MDCTLYNLPATAYIRSTPTCSINSRWNLGCNTSLSPIGKRLQTNLTLSSQQQRKNGFVVRAQTCPEKDAKVDTTLTITDGEQKSGTVENITSGNESDQKRSKVDWLFGSVDLFLPLRTMQQMLDMMQRDRLSVRTPWCMMENENEVKVRFDMPGLSKDDVNVSVEEKRFVVIEEKEKKEKDCWPSHSRYHTRLVLPENYETNKIKTEMKNGVLNMTIPKVKVQNSKMKDHTQNREAEKMQAEFKNGVLNITIPISKMESNVESLSVQ